MLQNQIKRTLTFMLCFIGYKKYNTNEVFSWTA